MILDPFSTLRRKRQLDALVEDFVIRCRAELIDRAGERALAMSTDVARGYLRAHARTLVGERIARARQHRLLASELAGPVLVERVIEGLVAHGDRELTKARVARDPWRKAA